MIIVISATGANACSHPSGLPRAGDEAEEQPRPLLHLFLHCPARGRQCGAQPVHCYRLRAATCHRRDGLQAADDRGQGTEAVGPRGGERGWGAGSRLAGLPGAACQGEGIDRVEGSRSAGSMVGTGRQGHWRVDRREVNRRARGGWLVPRPYVASFRAFFSYGWSHGRVVACACLRSHPSLSRSPPLAAGELELQHQPDRRHRPHRPLLVEAQDRGGQQGTRPLNL